MRINPPIARWSQVFLGLALLAFLIGGLMPSPVRTAIEQRLNMPFPVPPVAHLVLCAVMAATLRWWRSTWHAGAILMTVLLIGGIAEIGQHWIPGRTPDWHDMGLDLVGGIVGLLSLSCRHALYGRDIV